MLEQRGLRNPGRFGDPGQRGAVVAAVQEQSRGRGDDRLAFALSESAVVCGELCCHVSSFPSFTSALGEQLERWGASRFDILVNNAGVGIFGPLESVTTDDFDTVMGTNVRGTFFLTQALVPLLARGGRVINVSTSLTRHTSPATSVYSASKAAVEALSRTLAAELGPRGIRVNSVAPGPTATDFNGGAMRDDAGMRQVLAGQTALGRVGEPEEIGDAIATLASDGLRWVTAQRIEVSGGALL
ncbi:SDR family oxidoreductase [Streptomyces sp. NPDC093594]|uniref:SDR family NAD(P)-dependent oxidoreductase n=1 Tax=Streptomyces sp. NPDC093594 TaxID=3155305 RepID=UPI00344F0BDD